MRSCTHSSGFSGASCASRNPAQPPTRGCAPNSSERVELNGFGRRHGSPAPPGSVRGSAGPERARMAPPATRDKPLATRLTTFLFYFCSYLVSRRKESMLRLGSGLSLALFKELLHFAHDLLRSRRRDPERHVMAGQLDLLVAFMLEPARGTW